MKRGRRLYLVAHAKIGIRETGAWFGLLKNAREYALWLTRCGLTATVVRVRVDEGAPVYR